MLCQTAGTRLRERDHGPLRRAVGRNIVIALSTGDRSGVDDLAAIALRDHLAGGLLHADHAAKAIHTHYEVPIFLGYVHEVHRLVHARIVELDVEASEGFDRVRDHGADLLAVGDVHLHRGDLAFASVQAATVCLRDLTNALSVDVGEANLGPFVEQRFSDRPSDTPCRTRHDADTAGYTSHGASPFVLSLVGKPRGTRDMPRPAREKT